MTIRRSVMLYLLLCVTLLPLASAAEGTSVAAAASGASREEAQSAAVQRNLLAYLNAQRAAMGLSQVAMDAALNEAAKNHAAYYSANKGRRDESDRSAENGKLPGFTGATTRDRVKAAGYGGADRDVLRETVHVSLAGLQSGEYLREIMFNPTEREVVTDPNAAAVGIAVYKDTAVLIGASPAVAGEPESIVVSVYPYDGMTGVNIIYDNDPKETDPLRIGMSLTVHTNRHDVSNMQAWLGRTVDGRDIRVPLTVIPMSDGSGYHLAAGVPLRDGVAYTARVSFQAGGKTVERTWSFTTARFDFRFHIDDVPIVDFPPLYQEGEHMLVPMRLLFERLGAAVQWDKATQSITAVRQGRSVSMTIGSPAASVNGSPIPLDVPPRLIVYTTYIPVRFVSEALGFTVDYDKEKKTIDIWSHPAE